MATDNYPHPLPLKDKDGKVQFPITHVDAVIGAAPKENPEFTGDIKLNGQPVFGTVTDPGTGEQVPSTVLPPERGGTGVDTLQKLAQVLGVDGKIGIQKGGTGANTAAEALKNLGAASSITFTVAIPVSWQAYASGGYYQVINVAGMTVNDNPVVDILLSTDIAASKLQLEAWACVSLIKTQNGSIEVYCFDKAPTVAMTVQMLCVRNHATS